MKTHLCLSGLIAVRSKINTKRKEERDTALISLEKKVWGWYSVWGGGGFWSVVCEY